MSDPEREGEAAVSPDGETAALPSPVGAVDPRAETASLRGEIEAARARDAEQELGPGSLFGPFEIVEELGRGGMGVVYRAVDRDLGREVALKLLSPGLSSHTVELERFRREATLASKLRHPQIVGVYSFGELRGRVYYTMPIVEGQSLRELMKAGRVPPMRAAEIVEEVARAIDAAHQQRVVHRDLKPANVIIDEDGRPLVLDFGLAKDLVNDPELTRTGEVLGTPSYMSPEQARGESARVDHRVDVYALGAILYELLTGSVPYPGETVNEVIQKILHTDLVAPRAVRPDVPFELETVCLKALMDEAWLRYQTAGALADDLMRVRTQVPVQARRPGLGARLIRSVRRHRGASFMGVVLAVTVFLGVAFYQRGTTRAAIRQRSEQAIELLARATQEERRGETETASQTFHEAYLLAHGAFSDYPQQPKVRGPFMEVLRARADFAERRESWTLAEELRDLCFRLSGTSEDERLLRRARGRGRGEIRVAGLQPGQALDFVPWDREVGALAEDSKRRRRASSATPVVELEAGSYVATYGAKSGRQVRYLVVVAPGQRHEIVPSDPGDAPPGMVYVPGAEMVLPGVEGRPDEVASAGPLWIARTEVTVGAYREFLAHVEASGHSACGGCGEREHRPPGFPVTGRGESASLPVTGVTWYDANAYASWRGWRLPTRVEWLLAGGAADGRVYPWGDRYAVGRCNAQIDDLAPVETYARDVSPYGVIGLAGNGDEWCADEQQAATVPPAPHRVILGGGWSTGVASGELIQRSFARAEDRFADTSFRCVADAPPAEPLALGGEAPERVPAPAVSAGPPIVLRVAAWPRYADPRFTAAFAKRYLDATGVTVRVEQTVTVTSNDEFAPLLEQGVVDLVTPSCDMAPQIIRSGAVQAFDLPQREGQLLPAFRRPPFLQHAGRGYGMCYASGPMWLVSVDEGRVARSWSALWDPALRGKIAVWDDAVWAVTLAARDLGLSPVFDLRDEDLPRVREHLAALLANGCRTWRTPQDALRLVKEEGVVVLDDWGIVSWTLRGEGRWVHQEVPESGSALWIDSWMISSRLEGPELKAATAWIAYALSPENQRDLLQLVGYDPTNSHTVRVLDKATALSRLRIIRERRLKGLQRWREVPERQRYLDTWAAAKKRAE